MHSRPLNHFLFALVHLAFTCVATATAQESPSPSRSITAIRGDVYLIRDGARATVAQVTSAGVVLVDPLTPATVRWFRQEMESRSPDAPIRYVVLTRHDYERGAGASLLAETAEIVAHEAFPGERRRAQRTLPASVAPFDRNANQVLERSELTQAAAEVTALDRNRDNELTSAEAWGDVPQPETTFAGRRVIELGGRRVELIHPGNGFGPDATVVLFPQERLLFISGVLFDSLPASFLPSSPREFINSLRQVEALNFDTIVTGQGEMKQIADVGELREYVEQLVGGVKAGIQAGQTVEQVQASLELGDFKDMANFTDRRGRNIEETYRRMRLLTLRVGGALQLVHIQRIPLSCELNATPTIETACRSAGGPAAAGTGTASVMYGRFGGAIDYTAGTHVTGVDQQFRASPLTLKHSERVMSLLFRYELLPDSTLVLTAGKARISATQHCEGATSFFDSCSFQPTTHASGWANVIGADWGVTVGPARLVVPLRLMRAPKELYYGLRTSAARWTMQAGVGMAVPVARGAF